MTPQPAMVSEVRFSITISADEYLRYYRGQARDVLVTAMDGRRIRFPARILQSFVTRSGIRGSFVLRYDADGRFHSIERL